MITIYFGWNDHWVALGPTDPDLTLAHRLLWLADHSRLAALWMKSRMSVSDSMATRPNRVPLDRYRANMRAMIREAEAVGIRVVVVTAPSNHVRGHEPEYLKARHVRSLDEVVPLHQSYVSEATRSAARADGAMLCDAAAAFDRSDTKGRVVSARRHSPDRRGRSRHGRTAGSMRGRCGAPLEFQRFANVSSELRRLALHAGIGDRHTCASASGAHDSDHQAGRIDRCGETFEVSARFGRGKRKRRPLLRHARCREELERDDDRLLMGQDLVDIQLRHLHVVPSEPDVEIIRVRNDRRGRSRGMESSAT